MRAIEACRTSVLGGHVDVCTSCGVCHTSFNSCRNRHCPRCPALAQARWIAGRNERVLPTHYFHVVFTLPSPLRALVRGNAALLYDVLLKAAATTLLDLGKDPKHLGAQLGVTTVLHSWTRDLRYHPHAHCIVTGGGLDDTGERWIATSTKFLLPVRVLSPLFRGKFLASLRRLYRDGKLFLGGPCAELADPVVFARFVDDLYRTHWHVYSKPTFLGPEQLIKYLGRYTHRVGISDQRLRAVDADGVTFLTKGGKTATLRHESFIARFLQHVLPAGFAKIRHYGLNASSNAKTRLEKARAILDRRRPRAPVHTAAPTPPTWRDLMHEWTGSDSRRCATCGGTLAREPIGGAGLVGGLLAARPPPPDTS
jgi:hypothetical protein